MHWIEVAQQKRSDVLVFLALIVAVHTKCRTLLVALISKHVRKPKGVLAALLQAETINALPDRLC